MISLNTEKCIGCGVCFMVCPKQVFELLQIQSPLEIKCLVSVVKNPDKCDACGKCVRECPSRALSL